jgi:NADPH-dependent 7-cyano-7-deazaguanine reductase QueF
VTVSVRSYTERDFVHCLVVVECCLALEAVAFAVVALRYVTLILKVNKVNFMFHVFTDSSIYHEDCKVEFRDDFALCNPIQVQVDDKLVDLAPIVHCQVQHCGEF